MARSNLMSLGAALALTGAVIYLACAAVFAVWPEATRNFVNAWLQGADPRALATRQGGVFFYILFGIAVMEFSAAAFLVLFYTCIRSLGVRR